MMVGMLTVFLILLIVIWLSQALIALVNKVAPEEEPKKPAVVAAPSPEEFTVEAIKKAVSMLTVDKGQVVKIEKL